MLSTNKTIIKRLQYQRPKINYSASSIVGTELHHISNISHFIMYPALHPCLCTVCIIGVTDIDTDIRYMAHKALREQFPNDKNPVSHIKLILTYPFV